MSDGRSGLFLVQPLPAVHQMQRLKQNLRRFHQFRQARSQNGGPLVLRNWRMISSNVRRCCCCSVGYRCIPDRRGLSIYQPELREKLPDWCESSPVVWVRRWRRRRNFFIHILFMRPWAGENVEWINAGIAYPSWGATFLVILQFRMLVFMQLQNVSFTWSIAQGICWYWRVFI